MPVNTLADELGQRDRTLRQWLRRNYPETVRLVPHPDGGDRLLVNAQGAASARARYLDGTPARLASPPAQPAAQSASSASLTRESPPATAADSPEHTDAAVTLAMLDRAERCGRAEATLAAETARADRAETAQAAALARVAELERAVGHYTERVAAWRRWAAGVLGKSWWRRRRLADTPEDLNGPEVRG